MTQTFRKRPGGAAPSVRPILIEFLLDETGSMADCHGQTVSGYNAFLSEQRQDPAPCFLTLTKFDSRGQKTPYVDLDVRLIPPMSPHMFVPGGGTNLRDAMADRIEALRTRLQTWAEPPHVLFIVMTDGDDNCSRLQDRDVAGRLREQEAAGWTFVYLGSTPHALATAARLGFAAGNCRKYSTAEMHATMSDLAAATTVYRSTRTLDSGTERGYFSGVGTSTKF